MAARKPVGWGILSTGKHARKVALAVQAAHPGAIVAVASRDRTKAEAFVREVGLEGASAYGSYEALIADPKVEAIFNVLPNGMHLEWTLKAARAGKHTLCEKPLASNASEAQEMADGCQKAGVLLMEAFMYRLHPQSAKLLSEIQSGAIGELRFIRSAFCFIMEDLANVRLSASLAGGALMDVGCYCINFSRYMAQAEPLEVAAVAEFGAQSKVDEVFAGTLHFPRGIVAQFHVNFRVSGDTQAEVVGSKGKLRIERPWFPDVKSAAFQVLTGSDVRTVTTADGGNTYALEFERFAAAIRGQGPLPLPPEDGVRNMRVIDALYRAARTGQNVKLG
ncbi:MAG: oxidoreductase [Planctomycetota bacterium]